MQKPTRRTLRCGIVALARSTIADASRLAIALAALLSAVAMPGSATAAVLPQSVRTVSQPGQGGQFSGIQPAVDAAAPGDTILVGPGRYGPVTIDKPLTVVADHPGTGASQIDVRGIAAGELVVLEGLDAGGGTVPNVFTVSDCAGTVSLVDCTSETPLVLGGFTVTNSANVSLIRCATVGSNTFALRAEGSNLHAISCRFVGGFGGASSSSTGPLSSLDGAPGVLLSASTLVALDTVFVGGDGDPTAQGSGPGDGGDGLSLANHSVAYTRGCDFIGGAPGIRVTNQGVLIGQSGVPLLTDSNSAVVTVPGPVHRLLVDRPTLREGQVLTFTVEGPAGDLVALALSFGITPGFFPILNGTLLLDAGLDSIPLGVVPPSGMLQVPQTLGELGAGVSVQQLFVQVLALDLNAAMAYSGGGGVLTLLDASF